MVIVKTNLSEDMNEGGGEGGDTRLPGASERTLGGHTTRRPHVTSTGRWPPLLASVLTHLTVGVLSHNCLLSQVSLK